MSLLAEIFEGFLALWYENVPGSSCTFPDVESVIYTMRIHFLFYLFCIEVKDTFSFLVTSKKNFNIYRLLKMYNFIFANNMKLLELSSHWTFYSKHFCISLLQQL